MEFRRQTNVESTKICPLGSGKYLLIFQIKNVEKPFRFLPKEQSDLDFNQRDYNVTINLFKLVHQFSRESS